MLYTQDCGMTVRKRRVRHEALGVRAAGVGRGFVAPSCSVLVYSMELNRVPPFLRCLHLRSMSLQNTRVGYILLRITPWMKTFFKRDFLEEREDSALPKEPVLLQTALHEIFPTKQRSSSHAP